MPLVVAALAVGMGDGMTRKKRIAIAAALLLGAGLGLWRLLKDDAPKASSLPTRRASNSGDSVLTGWLSALASDSNDNAQAAPVALPPANPAAQAPQATEPTRETGPGSRGGVRRDQREAQKRAALAARKTATENSAADTIAAPVQPRGGRSKRPRDQDALQAALA